MKISQFLVLTIGVASFSSSCGCSSDQRFLNDINKVLSDNANSIATCYDAIKAIENAGYEINDFKIKDNQEFVYDSVAKQFVLMENDKIVKATGDYHPRENKMDYFKSVFVYNPNSQYSQYLDKRAEVPEQLFISTGFDIGDHKDIPYIAYSNLSNKAQDVIVRTFSDYFSVLAPLDTVHHYCVATNVVVTDVSTLDEHAVTGYTVADKGYINFAKDSSSDIFEVKKGQEGQVSIDVADFTKFYYAINISKTKAGEVIHPLVPALVSNETELKDALNNSTQPFVRLQDDIDTDTLDFKYTCLDLNGRKLTLNGHSSSHIGISVSGGSMAYILDSQATADENSGIVLNDSYISVMGQTVSTSDPTSLTINSGKITQYVDSINYPTIACSGNVDSSTHQTAYPANVAMYGGKIETHFSSSASTTDVACFCSVGNGANLEIIYGNLVSDSSCIICPSNEEDYDFSGSSLTIQGGHFNASQILRSACVDYRESGDIKIEGGEFTGSTCISAVGGSVNIDNSTLNAVGKFHEGDVSHNGSSLCFYLKDKGSNLIVNVTDATISSTFGCIVTLYSLEGSTGQLTVNLNEGKYNYLYGEGYLTKGDKIILNIKDHDAWVKHDFPN